jgi:serine/threonine protein kinase
MSDRVGEQFGEYRLTRKLGGGTFGDVYLGEHTGNNTPAAVKILQARLTNSEDLKDYINEIRSLFRLQHPNIVPLLDFGIERDTPFLIMAYAPNGTLRQPKGTRLPLDTVVGYIKQIAEALQHAHDRKLIHRDVKPDNILSGPDGQVWLSDFGIVSIAQSSRSLNTQDGAGTIPYMAPEQILGKPRLASDQYALGIIAYEWICGSRPFNGTAIEIAMQHSQAQPQPLREQVPTLAPAIEQVVLRALAKDPKDRFASVREFAEALAIAVEQSKPRPVRQKTKEQWVNEGDAFYNAGRYKEAIEVYDNAIRLDPRYEVSYNNRGNSYRKLGEYTRAIEDYNRAIELDPRYANAYGGRGFTYYYLNDYQRAIQGFDYALQLDPGITWFKSEREDAYRKFGKKLLARGDVLR